MACVRFWEQDEFEVGMMGYRTLFLVFCVFVGVWSVEASAFDAAVVFDKKCSSCHTIGGGDLKGPDLKGVTERRTQEWLVQFIPSADAMIQSGDPAAVKIYNDYGQKDMPDQKLSSAEIVELLKFIESGGVVSGSGVTIKPANSATPADLLKGEDLYLGALPLSNGGPACVNCHSIGDSGPMGGGTLAKDLTHSFPDYNDKGMDVALQKLAFPVMEEVFNGKPLTEEEIFLLKSFMYDADMKGESSAGFQKKFIFLGLCGVVGSMGVIDFAWRRRRKESVRKAEGGIR